MADMKQKLDSLVIQSEHISRGVHEALDADLKNEKRKAAVFTIVIFVMIGYMTWMITMIKQIDAEYVTEFASSELVLALPRLSGQGADFIEQKLPELHAQLHNYVDSQFDAVVGQVEGHARTLFRDAEEELRDQLKENMTEFVVETHRDVIEHIPASERHRSAEIFAQEFSKHYKEHMVEVLRSEHNAINEHLDEMRDYLANLKNTSDENLSVRQRSEKGLIRAVAALVQISVAEHTAEGGGH